MLLLLTACGPATPPYGEDLPLGTLCTTVDGQEHCADGEIVGTRTSDGFRVSSDVSIPGMQLGFDEVEVTIEAEVRGGGEVGAFSVMAPLAVDCLLVQAHGDHCHPEVEVPMACAMTAGPQEGAVLELVDWGDDHVYALFEGRFDVDAPPCCENQCAWHIPAEAAPAGPYRFTGVVHAALAPEGSAR